jgi:2-oxo-4-hydroxy-4-carboxy--5-ureidoimidazoline (OHCU) decarboxylase
MPALNPERLMALLQQFINAPSWDQSRRVLEQHPELLTPEADALLGRVLEHYRDDPRAVRMLTEHRDLLRRCRAEGVEAAFADLESGDAAPEAALRALMERAESDPEARAVLEERAQQVMEHPLAQATQALVEADSPAEVVEAMQTHPDLLSDEADEFIRHTIKSTRDDDRLEMACHLEERYQALRQIREQMREEGITPQPLTEWAAAQEQMAAALAGLPEHLQRVLADVTSQEELEAALEEHPELAEALAQAAGSTEPSEQPALIQTIYQFINTDN